LVLEMYCTFRHSIVSVKQPLIVLCFVWVHTVSYLQSTV